MADLKEGMAAPLFSGKDQNGNVVRLEHFVGKKIILYFYPKDNTPGCTSESCNLRDHYADLAGRRTVAHRFHIESGYQTEVVRSEVSAQRRGKVRIFA